MDNFSLFDKEDSKKANWLPLKKGMSGYSAGDFYCSLCGKPNRCYSLTPYCANCGAKMKKGRTT